MGATVRARDRRRMRAPANAPADPATVQREGRASADDAKREEPRVETAAAVRSAADLREQVRSMVNTRLPVSTYRLQFHSGFRLADAQRLVPYLRSLGITDLYASPLVRARSASLDGLDVTDPTQLNPELGTPDDLESLHAALAQNKMGLLLDWAPDHMAASPDNPWWRDVLEHGPASPYAFLFDIDWKSGTDNKVVLPILARPYPQALTEGELHVDLADGELQLHYGALDLPLDPKTYSQVLRPTLEAVGAAGGADSPAFRSLAELVAASERLPDRSQVDANAIEARRRLEREAKAALRRLGEAEPAVRGALAQSLRTLNGVRNDPPTLASLERLVGDQAYQLMDWREGLSHVNYRRSDDLPDLVALRMHDPRAFETVHATLFSLIERGRVTGLRIDHVDGLQDPAEYLQRLQQRLAPRRTGTPFYVVVDKVLMGEEGLSPDWPTYGTTGYEFANALNGVFVDAPGLERLREIYATFAGTRRRFEDVAHVAKRRVAKELFPAELLALAGRLAKLGKALGREVPEPDLADAIAEVTAALPVYRTYARSGRMTAADRARIDIAFQDARRRAPEVPGRAFELARRVILTGAPRDADAGVKDRWSRFLLRWQQFTGPVAAKGLEDTALYVHHPLLSLNEVGRAQATAKTGVERFHRLSEDRRRLWPHALSATSTHDTKRGEDVRARLNVLTELPEEWEGRLRRWHEVNAPLRPLVHGKLAPDRNEEYFLYETLLGAWPVLESDLPSFDERLAGYLVKAVREAKVHSNWLAPDEAYERAVVDFARGLLHDPATVAFRDDFVEFQRTLGRLGMLNSIGQLVLKIAAPGVPDFYQGAELWDLNLVDPDNRRPVDFGHRATTLAEVHVRASEEYLREILDHWPDGRVKMFTMRSLLRFRVAHPAPFQKGEYLPLKAEGPRARHVCAFARKHRSEWVVVAVPRLVAGLERDAGAVLGEPVWAKTMIRLPEGAPTSWREVLTERRVEGNELGLPLTELFRYFPGAVLHGSGP